MSDVVETEWQFEASDLERVRQWLEAQPAHAPLTFAQVRDREQVDSYSDTADWRLYHAGFSLRRRSTGEAYELTLKGLGSASEGPLARREITESSADGTMPGMAGPVSDRVRRVAGPHELRRLFEVRTRRRTFAVRSAAERVAVVELDETTIAPISAPVTTFRRVEVEVEPGAPAIDIESFVEAMAITCDLKPTRVSKYEMGLRVAGLDPGTVFEVGSTERDPGAGAAAFAFGWMRTHWAAFLRHEPGTRLGEEIEFLHQMRVSTRRLRAAIRVFAPVLPPHFEQLRDELQWVGHELGAVRDLDVQIEELEALRAASAWAESAALAPLVAVVERERVAEREQLLALLDSPRYDALVESMSRALREGPPLPSTGVAGEVAPEGQSAPSVWSFAAPILRRRFRQVRRDRRALHAGSSPHEYHELRIRAKRLRYSLELFGELYGDPASRVTSSVKAIQDHLGEHQDADVGIARLHAIVAREGASLPPESLVAAGQLIERYAQRMVGLRTGFPDAWAPFPRHWKRLRRAIAEAEARAAADAPKSAPTRPAPPPAPPASATPAQEAPSVAEMPATETPATEAPAAPARPYPAPSAHPPTPPVPPVAPPDAGGTSPESSLMRMRHLFQGD